MIQLVLDIEVYILMFEFQWVVIYGIRMFNIHHTGYNNQLYFGTDGGTIFEV